MITATLWKKISSCWKSNHCRYCWHQIFHSTSAQHVIFSISKQTIFWDIVWRRQMLIIWLSIKNELACIAVHVKEILRISVIITHIKFIVYIVDVFFLQKDFISQFADISANNTETLNLSISAVFRQDTSIMFNNHRVLDCSNNSLSSLNSAVSEQDIVNRLSQKIAELKQQLVKKQKKIAKITLQCNLYCKVRVMNYKVMM